MRHEFLRPALFAAVSLNLATAASAGPVLKIACPEGIYHEKPFDFTVDLGTQEVSDTDIKIVHDGVTEQTITFSFMRGNAVFHRDTHVFEWDARAQYSYVAASGYPPEISIDDFMGSAVCTVEETP